MALGFQTNAFQHTNGFQGGSGAIVTVVPARPVGGSTGKARRQVRRTIVEIDGRQYTVRSEDDARSLLAQEQAKIVAQADRAAKTALNKARDVERKTGKLPTLEIAVPELSVADGADEAIRALVMEAQQGVDEAFLRAAQSAELAFLAHRSYLAQDEEDALMALLLG